jgi:hypothetical protein
MSAKVCHNIVENGSWCKHGTMDLKVKEQTRTLPNVFYEDGIALVPKPKTTRKLHQYVL